jgi:hypothetical protein
MRQLGIKLPQAAFEIEVREIRRRAVSRPCDQHRVEIVTQDQVVEMRIDEVDPRTRTPMPEQPIFT